MCRTDKISDKSCEERSCVFKRREVTYAVTCEQNFRVRFSLQYAITARISVLPLPLTMFCFACRLRLGWAQKSCEVLQPARKRLGTAHPELGLHCHYRLRFQESMPGKAEDMDYGGQDFRHFGL